MVFSEHSSTKNKTINNAVLVGAWLALMVLGLTTHGLLAQVSTEGETNHQKASKEPAPNKLTPTESSSNESAVKDLTADPVSTPPQMESSDQASDEPPQSTESQRLSQPLTPAPELSDKGQRQLIYDSAVDFAEWIDRFFGETQALESAGYDYLRLVNRIDWAKGDGAHYRPRIKAKVNLPKIDKKLSLMFDDGDDSGGQSDSVQNNDILQNVNQTNGTSAALNYESEVYDRSKFDTRVGLDSHLDSFALIKHTFKVYESETLLFRNFNYLFWKEKELFGVNPRIELIKIINDNNIFRWRYSINRSEKSEGNEWHNTFSIVHQISEERWVSYDIGAHGATEQPYDVEAYRAAVRFRRRAKTIEWLYFEIEPELVWRKTIEDPVREFVPGIIFRFEVKFEH